MIELRMKNKKIILIILGVILFSSWVYADCVVPFDGMVITQNTTFCKGEYYLPNGIFIQNNNVTLNCYGAILKGNNSINDYGIYLTFPGKDNNIITNCTISNYNFGMFLYHSDNNLIFNNIFISDAPIWSALDLYGSSNNIFKENIIMGSSVNAIQIQTSGRLQSNYNNITQNIINPTSIGNPHENSIFIWDSHYNNIWDNDIYNKPIYNTGIEDNIFCINCIGNHYYDGATGPLCPISCSDEDKDGIPNSEDKCPNTTGEQIVYGCSCQQILKLKPGKDESKECSEGIIEVFTKQIGWAKNLFNS